MHLLQAQDSSPLDADEAIDLGQSPGDVVVLSAADTELSALALASQSLENDGTRLRIANLGMLKHPYSVDLYVEAVLADAKLVIVRALGAELLAIFDRTSRACCPGKGHGRCFTAWR